MKNVVVEIEGHEKEVKFSIRVQGFVFFEYKTLFVARETAKSVVKLLVALGHEVSLKEKNCNG
jgi:hypothetical protein